MLKRTNLAHPRSLASILSVAVVLSLAACGTTQTSVSVPDRARRAGQVTLPVAATRARATKVLVLIEENHSYAQMRSGMPYLTKLSNTYGYATHWTALAHPSEPNYLGIAGGSTFGITDDKAPTAHKAQIGSANSVFDQALAAGRTAAAYAESMPKNCHIYDYPDRANGVPKYAVRHNPWVYFPSHRADCLAHDFPLTNFAHDAAKNALPNVGFLIPNLDHDAHDGSLSTADVWLRQTLAPVLASSDFATGKLVVIVTADEDDKKAGNTVLTSVLTPALSHKVATTPLTHYSLTRYIAQVLGVSPLRNGAHAPDLKAAFGL
jgi:acid phosphatase